MQTITLVQLLAYCEEYSHEAGWGVYRAPGQVVSLWPRYIRSQMRMLRNADILIAWRYF